MANYRAFWTMKLESNFEEAELFMPSKLIMLFFGHFEVALKLIYYFFFLDYSPWDYDVYKLYH